MPFGQQYSDDQLGAAARGWFGNGGLSAVTEPPSNERGRFTYNNPALNQEAVTSFAAQNRGALPGQFSKPKPPPPGGYNSVAAGSFGQPPAPAVPNRPAAP